MVDQGPIIKCGLNALAEIAACIDEIEKFRQSFENGPVIINQPRIVSAIRRLCYAQAEAHACLFDNGNRPIEGKNLRKLRLSRIKDISEKCKHLDIRELRNKRVRNALAHFDEYYLNALSNHMGVFWLQDVAISHMQPSVYSIERFIRVYCYENRNIYLFGRSIDTNKLKEEVFQIVEALGLKLQNQE